MSANFNKVILLGNLTRDPDLRYTPKGTACCQLGLALNRTWKSETGEKREEVTFVDVTVWGAVGEAAAKYHKKGDPIHISGRLKLDTWTDKQSGNKRSKLGVVGEEIQFIKPYDQNRAPASPPSAGPSGQPAPEQPEDDDDVPF